MYCYGKLYVTVLLNFPHIVNSEHTKITVYLHELHPLFFNYGLFV